MNDLKKSLKNKRKILSRAQKIPITFTQSMFLAALVLICFLEFVFFLKKYSSFYSFSVFFFFMLLRVGGVYMFKTIKGGGRTRKAAGTPAACNIYLCH